MNFSTQQLNTLLDIIKRDDLTGFSSAVLETPEIFNLVFGRFPILSLCYLYNAKKIAKKYNSDFCNATRLIKVIEPSCAYIKFKNLAGVHLRKYTGDNTAITPAEILALSYETDYLKSNYKNLKPPQSACDNITAICTRRNQKAKIDHLGIKVAPQPYKPLHRIAFLLFATFMLGFVIMFASLVGTIFPRIGFGTADRPFIIESLEQLKIASTTNAHYILTTDLVFPGHTTIDNFSANLNGNGFSITTDGRSPVFGANSGTISNLNIYASSDTPITIDNNFAFFVLENNGNLVDINIFIDANIIVANPHIERVGGAILYNGRVVQNVAVGGVLNVTTLATSNIFVGGLVAFNSDHPWGLNRELATITHSYSSIALSLNAPNAITDTVLRLGGVASINYGLIRYSAHSGSLNAVHSTGVSDLGSIAAYNNQTFIQPTGGILYNNGAFGTILNDASGYALTFLGGIVGWAGHGRVENNFSIATIYATPLDGVYIGGIVGAVFGLINIANGNRYFDFRAYFSNNYYVARPPNITRGKGQIYATPDWNNWFTHSFEDYQLQVLGNLFLARSEQQVRELNIFWQREGV